MVRASSSHSAVNATAFGVFGMLSAGDSVMHGELRFEYGGSALAIQRGRLPPLPKLDVTMSKKPRLLALPLLPVRTLALLPPVLGDETDCCRWT